MSRKIVVYTPSEKAAETRGAAVFGAVVGGCIAGPIGAIIGGLLVAIFAD